MMNPAERDGELVRNPPAECTRLGIADMVSLAGLPSAHRARLNGNEPQMIFVARAPRLDQAKATVCNGFASAIPLIRFRTRASTRHQRS